MESSDTNVGSSCSLIRLSPEDNVLVAARTLFSGTKIMVEGRQITLNSAIGLGHKVAARSIKEGEKIYKCSAPIGSATRAISTGEHVHLHNMKSDYIPATVRNDSKSLRRMK